MNAQNLMDFHTEPLSNFVHQILQNTVPNNPLISGLLASLLVLIQSFYVNFLINKHKLTYKKNYFGGIVYILFCSLLQESQFLSPQLIASTFLLLIIDRIFTLSKQERLPTKVFDLGLYCGIAILFYFPSCVFLFLLFLGLLTVRQIDFKETMILFSGLFCPIFAVFVYYFCNDFALHLPLDITNYKNWIPFSFHFEPVVAAKLITIGLVSIWAFIHVQVIMSSAGILLRKFVGILTATLGITFGAYFLQFHASIAHLILMVVPLSFSFSIYFIETKTPIIADVIFILLFLLSFATQFLV